MSVKNSPTFLRPARTLADFVNLIVSARHARQFTQAELAKRAGVSRAWLAAVERGKPRMDFGLILRTLAALDVQLVARTKGEEKSARSTSRIPPINIDRIIEAARRREP